MISILKMEVQSSAFYEGEAFETEPGVIQPDVPRVIHDMDNQMDCPDRQIGTDVSGELHWIWIGLSSQVYSWYMFYSF